MPESLSHSGRPPSLARRATRVLLDRGLIDAADIHRYGITGRDVSESNGVALIELGNGRGYAAKDISPARIDGQGDPVRETDVYRLAAGLPSATAVLPRLILVDEDERLLIVEGITAARRLDRLDGGRAATDPDVLDATGHALGQWHRTAGQAVIDPVYPWLLFPDSSAQPEALARSTRLAELRTEINADPDHRAALESARSMWTASTVMHGDVRFANILVRQGPVRAVLIDWEFAGLGDPDWDLAGIVAEYISAGWADPAALADGPIAALLAAYERAAVRSVDPVRLADFVACRLLLRAYQLTTWVADAADAQATVERHRAHARSVRRPVRSR